MGPARHIAATLAIAALASLGAAASRPATAPATRPATAPADTYPDAKLVDACQARREELRRQLDESFAAVVSPPFVVAGNMPASRLQTYARHSVVRPAEVMWGRYFRARPAEPITILLLADAESYRHWSRHLFGDRELPHFGYYRSASRTMVMNIATGTGTLVHELTHALIAPDFPDVPSWFNEGLASLHEQCVVQADDVVGLTNWRLPALQKAIRDGKLRPLRELMTQGDFYGRQEGLNYAQARYFVMYMQHRGVLKAFYEHFRANHEGAEAGVQAVQRVFEDDLGKVEKAFLDWVQTLRWPAE